MTGTLQPACLDALRTVAAGIDGSAAARAAQHHVEHCPACASVADDAGGAEAVLAALAAHRPPRAPVLRWVLGIAASLQCALALPWLFGFNPLDFLASSHVASEHLTRDGAIGMIIGVAGITTAIRTRHALAMLVMAAAAVGMQVLSFVVDENHDRVHPLFETSHALIPLVLALVAVFAFRRAAPVGAPQRGRNLRAVR